MKIYRLVTKKNNLGYHKAKELITNFFEKVKEKDTNLLVVTPGGFVNDKFPEKKIKSTGWGSKKQEFIKITNFAEKLLFKNLLIKDVRQLFKERSKLITIGYDLTGQNNAELVAVYDTQKEKIIKWTGKSYPTSFQENILYQVKDIETHFLKYDKERFLILGCHDLNIFSPRSKANRLPTSLRGKLCTDFISKTKKFNPTIVIQHPHTTHSPRIWGQGWSGIRHLFPEIKSYCSGICHYSPGRKRRPIESVLRSTKKDDLITDIIL